MTKTKITRVLGNITVFSLLVLPFFIVGIWTMYISLTSFYEQIQTRNWIPIEAEIQDIKYVSTEHISSDNRRGESYEVKCIYTYFFNSVKYTNTIISIGYGSNNTENHSELFNILKYVNKLTVYVNPDKNESSVIVKGTNSSTISLMIISILWNGFILIFLSKNIIVPRIFALLFVCSIILIASGVLHTDFRKKINIIEKKSEKEIDEIIRKSLQESIKYHENREKN